MPRGYSNGVLAPYGRRLLAVAGQIGWLPNATMVTPIDGEDAFVAQFRQALHNVATIVRTAGGEPTDVMSLRLSHQLRQVQAGDRPGNLVRPSELGVLEQQPLHDALAIVRRFRSVLSQRFRVPLTPGFDVYDVYRMFNDGLRDRPSD